jgi:S-(hydroxymethyl)glutathione dehydrogenase/alcohol dehydrogenase
VTLPRTTQAAILVEQNKPLVLAEIDLPDILLAGQVLVQIHYSGICGSQIGEINGVKGPDAYLPHLLGHEASGTVLAIGSGVRYVKVDDKVVLHWRKGPGIDAAPAVYQWNGRRVNAGCVTTFSSHAVVSENRLTSIPRDSELDVAALFGCAVTTGFGVVVNNAKLSVGESVVVYGAGGIGLSIVQAAAMVSAHPIVAVDLHDDKLALACSLGATVLINARNEDARAVILAAVGKAGPDVFIDNTGHPEAIQLGYEITKPEGRVVLVGVPRKGQNISIYSLPLHFGKQLAGSHGGEARPETDIPRYHALYRAGRLPLRSLITDCFDFPDVNDALNRMRQGTIRGRCLLKL